MVAIHTQLRSLVVAQTHNPLHITVTVTPAPESLVQLTLIPRSTLHALVLGFPAVPASSQTPFLVRL